MVELDKKFWKELNDKIDNKIISKELNRIKKDIYIELEQKLLNYQSLPSFTYKKGYEEVLYTIQKNIRNLEK